jgi:hypothetical protein
MKPQKWFGLCLALMLTITLSASAALAAGQGEEIMREQKKRHEVNSETSSVVMLLVDDKGNKEKRLLDQFSKKAEKGESRAMMVFLDPADIKGTALLTWEHDTTPSDQWLYLPAQKKMQRIAQGSKKSYFMGTDFTYEDLEPEDIENFSYTVLAEEPCDGGTCWKIEAVPANPETGKDSGYAKRLMWVRQDNYVTVKIEFFDRRERLLKTQTAQELENVEGTVWRARKTLMDNHKENHKTLMGLKERAINQPIADEVFTERYILSGRHVK